MSVPLPISIHADIPLTADIVADGVEKRIPTLDEISQWNEGGGGLPAGTTLEEIVDGPTRAAVSPSDLPKLAAYVINDGKTGDAHALRTDNPHTVTAAQVGAPTTAQFSALEDEVDANTAAAVALDARVDTLEATASTHTSDLTAIDTRVDNLEGAAVQWVAGPMLVRNAQAFTDLGAGPSQWTNSLWQKVSLWKASRMFFWSQVGVAGASGSKVRAQYTTDLTGATGWTDITGADVAIDAVAIAGVSGSIINVPSGAKSQEFVLMRTAGVGGDGTADPSISFFTPFIELTALGAPGSGGGGGVDSFNGRTGAVNPATNDYSYDQIAETATGKKFTATLKTKLDGIESGAEVNDVASVFGRTGTVVAATGDYTTAQLTESTDKKFVTDAEKTKLTNVPSDTNAAIALKANSTDVTSALAAKADVSALNAKAALASPAFTGTPTAPTPTTTDNTTKLATTAFVQAQPVKTHTHGSAADVTGLPATLTDLQNQINQLSGGSSVTSSVLTVTSATDVNIPDSDVVYVEHSGFNANVRIPASWTKKPHTVVFIGNPNTVNVAGATGSGQSIKGGAVTFASGTDGNAVSRIVCPDPDTTNFPNRWRVF